METRTIIEKLYKLLFKIRKKKYEEEIIGFKEYMENTEPEEDVDTIMQEIEESEKKYYRDLYSEILTDRHSKLIEKIDFIKLKMLKPLFKNILKPLFEKILIPIIIFIIMDYLKNKP